MKSQAAVREESYSRANSEATELSSESEDHNVNAEFHVDTDQKKKKKGMVLPFEPHSITFYEIKYSVDMPQVLESFFVHK